jgi:hypothetical protein
MPGPLRTDTDNVVLETPLVENDPAIRLRPPASNTSDPGKSMVDTGSFIYNGGVKLPDVKRRDGSS